MASHRFSRAAIAQRKSPRERTDHLWRSEQRIGIEFASA
jgi:hypothetical protein